MKYHPSGAFLFGYIYFYPFIKFSNKFFGGRYDRDKNTAKT